MNNKSFVQAKIAVNAVIRYKGKYLLVQQSRPEYHYGKWSLPGGKVDIGESFEEALVREVYEETNLQITLMKEINIIHEQPSRTVKHIYFVEYIGEIDNLEFDSREILDVKFFDRSQITKLCLRGDWVVKSIDCIEKNAI